MANPRVSFRMSPAFIQKMKRVAKDDKRTPSQWLRLVVERELKRNGAGAGNGRAGR